MNESTPTSTVNRRTILTAAAWSAPVIAASVATPAMAASLATPTLMFDGPYAVKGCAPVPPMTLMLTSNGRDFEPNAVVVVTLPRGFEWPDGGVGSREFTTDATGRIRLIGVRAPIENVSSAEITAKSLSEASASSAISVAITSLATIFVRNLDVSGSPTSPAAVRATFEGPVKDIRAAQNMESTVAYLTTDGRLYSANGQLLDSGVSAFSTSVDFSGNRIVFWGRGNSVFTRILNAQGVPQGTMSLLFTTAANVVQIDAAWNTTSTVGILDAAGTLYSWTGKTIATGVAAFCAQVNWERQRSFGYAKKTGSKTTVYRQLVGEEGVVTGAPETFIQLEEDIVEMKSVANPRATSTNSMGAMLTASGRLHSIPPMGGTSVLIAENVEAFAPFVSYDGIRKVFYSTKNAAVWEYDFDASQGVQIARNVGLISTIRSAANGNAIAMFLSKTGRLYNYSGGLIAENVPVFDVNVDATTLPAVRRVFYAQYQPNC